MSAIDVARQCPLPILIVDDQGRIVLSRIPGGHFVYDPSLADRGREVLLDDAASILGWHDVIVQYVRSMDPYSLVDDSGKPLPDLYLDSDLYSKLWLHHELREQDRRMPWGVA